MSKDKFRDPNIIFGMHGNINPIPIIKYRYDTSITINSDAAVTYEEAITLSLSATDASTITAYYISLSSTTPASDDAGWTDITPTANYSDDVLFQLSGENGIKTVYVWYKDPTGNVAQSLNDSINWKVFTAHIIATSAHRAYSVYAIDVDGDNDLGHLRA